MKKILAFCAVWLIVSGMLFPAFSQKVRVQVFDQKLRPIAGAQVYVEHQLNDVQGYVKTKPVLTDQNGFAEITFTNYEQIESEVDYTYRVYVKYGGQMSTYSLISTGNINDVKTVSETSMKSYFLNVKVIDQKGAALPATITVGGQSKKADAAGSAIFQLPPGNFTVKAEAGGAVRTREITLAEDSAVDLRIGLYTMEVSVSDDTGKPLIAAVETEGKKAHTGLDGKAYFYNLSNQFPQVVVRYNQTLKRFSMDLERQPLLLVHFDLTPPVVREAHVSLSKTGAATLSVFVEDPGGESSGIDSLSISYEVDGVENKVPAYAIGYNTFEAKIPPQAPKTLVKYFIKVADGEGNIALSEGSYFVPSEEEPKQNKSLPPKPAAAKQQEGGIEPLAVGLLIFVIVTFGVFYYLRNRQAGPRSQQPKPPPVPPA
ncbi:MAG: hypothetical protein N3F07_01165 [Candidatus Micrarchaeota archaeon]|nr:hypothetical protein [Candidatus Micrarchaeota archaeon]